MTIYLDKLKKLLNEAGKGEYYSTAVISYAEKLINNDLPVIFDKVHITKVLGISLENLNTFLYADKHHYKPFSIPKKTGGERNLHVPSMPLKLIQRWILDNILQYISVSNYATAFCKDKSIYDNAKQHIDSECVINLDIENFFPSISIKQVYGIFYYYGYTREVSHIFAKLCTYEDFLPQGSPASPYISNLVCYRLDQRLAGLAKKYKANYTRYADDITFSGGYGINSIIETAKLIIQDEGFELNAKKTRIQYKYQRQVVTGLIINNGKISISKKYKKQIMQEIFYCKKYGVYDHLKRTKKLKAYYKEYMYGKAYFVKMIEPMYAKKILKELDEIIWDY